jgi:hypothetical protein
VPYVFCGDVDIVLETRTFHPPLTDEEAREVAEAVAAQFAKRVAALLADTPGVTFTFEVESASYGCVRMRLLGMLGGGLLGLLTAASMWPQIRTGLPAMLEDVSSAIDCVVRQEQLQCDELRARWRTVEHIYQVRKGDTLSSIVNDVWKVPHVEQQKVMRWVLKNYHHAFIDGDMHRIKAGAFIGKPTKAHIKGMPGSE